MASTSAAWRRTSAASRSSGASAAASRVSSARAASRSALARALALAPTALGRDLALDRGDRAGGGRALVLETGELVARAWQRRVRDAIVGDRPGRDRDQRGVAIAAQPREQGLDLAQLAARARQVDPGGERVAQVRQQAVATGDRHRGARRLDQRGIALGLDRAQRRRPGGRVGQLLRRIHARSRDGIGGRGRRWRRASAPRGARRGRRRGGRRGAGRGRAPAIGEPFDPPQRLVAHGWQRRLRCGTLVRHNPTISHPSPATSSQCR